MSSAPVESLTWAEANQRSLVSAVDEIRACLEARVDGEEPVPFGGSPDRTDSPFEGPRTALEGVSAAFGLSSFERAVLLLCAGVELEASFAALLARVQGTDGHRHGEPTFSLAMAALPGAHWSAITPAGPLRRWRLIEVAPGPSLTTSPLRIDERILHHLAGVSHVDERLAGAALILPSEEGLVPSQRNASDRIAAAWTNGQDVAPLVHLCGRDPEARRTVAVAASAAVGLSVLAIPSSSLPADPSELDVFARLCEREGALLGAAILLEHGDMEAGEPSRDQLVDRFTAILGSALMLGSSDRRPSSNRRTLVIDVNRPTPAEQRTIWRQELGGAPSDELVELVVSQFDLNAGGIRDAAIAARGASPQDLEGTVGAAFDHRLWEACRRQARPALDDLAQPIEPVARWDDLVLPVTAAASLKEIGIHARHRSTVYERWGFADRGPRGLGISALFVGASGTGKTTAAEVLAADLGLDLYRIDLSQVVSKYIGETEKNLRRVFDAAEEGGAVLLFDEADALFGKRSEVRDSHDRHANIEVSYLLQRMEAYRGLAILTTNMKEALDTAFLRRIRFIVQFPFPDAPARAEIWRRIFPAATPVDGLDPIRLAQLNLSGGSIRNVAVSSAFLAAEARTPVRLEHVLQAARSEYAKLDRTLTAAEIGGWT